MTALGSASADRVTIDARFNGPPTTANGGCACGVAARYVDGPAEVALRAPVPLGTALAVERRGEAVLLRDGDQVVAEARPARAPDVEPPVRPDGRTRRAAMADAWQGRPALFARCWVCSPDREDGLGRHVRAAPRPPGRAPPPSSAPARASPRPRAGSRPRSCGARWTA